MKCQLPILRLIKLPLASRCLRMIIKSSKPPICPWGAASAHPAFSPRKRTKGSDKKSHFLCGLSSPALPRSVIRAPGCGGHRPPASAGEMGPVYGRDTASDVSNDAAGPAMLGRTVRPFLPHRVRRSIQRPSNSRSGPTQTSPRKAVNAWALRVPA